MLRTHNVFIFLIMMSDEKPELLFHAKYLWKTLHSHFQGRGKTIILQLFCTSISEHSRNLIHSLQKTTKKQVYVREMESLMASYRLC